MCGDLKDEEEWTKPDREEKPRERATSVRILRRARDWYVEATEKGQCDEATEQKGLGDLEEGELGVGVGDRSPRIG